MFIIRACTAGATAGYLGQNGGSLTASYHPECNGKESNISDCHHLPLSECNSAKIYVTCFKEDPVSGPLCNSVSAGPTSASPTTQLPTATSVASPPHTTTGTGSTDPNNSGITPSTNVGVPSSGHLGTTYTIIIIIFIAVCIIATLVLFMAVMFAVIKYKKYKHSDTANVHFKKHDPDESVLYSEEMDVPIEQRQQESFPVYETIMKVSVNTARISATDAYPVDLEENIAYETSPADLKENIAYETHLNPVDLKKNIAYEMRINVDI